MSVWKLALGLTLVCLAAMGLTFAYAPIFSTASITPANPINAAGDVTPMLESKVLEETSSPNSAAHSNGTAAKTESIIANRKKPAEAKPSRLKPGALPADEVAAIIDRHFSSYWKLHNITPPSPAHDYEFLRRCSLDITGKIPSAGEARAYLDDPTPEKRMELVRRLLRQARFSSHMAVTLRDALLAGAAADPQKSRFLPGFEAWLRLRLSEAVPYDRLIVEMLTARTDRNDDPLQARNRVFGPEAFYLVHEEKPELLAGAAARALLGVQVQCAECHHHPFAEWKQEQFWSLAAMFAPAPPPGNPMDAVLFAKMSIAIPNKNKTVQAAFLDGAAPKLPASASVADRRAAVADWLVANPLFAKAIVNRVWKHFLGVGLVDPVDDFGPDHPPSHAEVLELLAEQFRLSGYNLTTLAETIAATRMYSSSNRPTDDSQKEAIHHACMPIRAMTPEQMYDSIQRATAGRSLVETERGTMMNPLDFMGGRRADFLRRFAEPGERTSARGSVLQSLSLMNGDVLKKACDPDTGPQLAAMLNSPFLDDAGKTEMMFLATLSRRPNQAESSRINKRLASVGDKRSKRNAFGDLYWALLNTAEFAHTP